MIDVLLVADVRLHADGLAALLERANDRIAVSVADARDPGFQRRAARVDVIVAGAGADELEALCTAAACAQRPIVAVGAPDAEQGIVALARVGVLGFVGPDAGLDDLVAGIESAACGQASFPPRIATTLLRSVSRLAQPAAPELSTLTMREREIVHLIGEGLSNKGIAARLCIEVATVKNHVHNILEKLQVNRRAEAVARLRLVEGGYAPAEVPGAPAARQGAPPRGARAAAQEAAAAEDPRPGMGLAGSASSRR